MPRKGRFIVLEGGDGAGKSSQAKMLSLALNKLGHKTVLTREVGGSDGAEAIRHLWLHGGKFHKWDSLTELLLVMAARRDHLVKKIWPALQTGKWVISDRYFDSTFAYQGAGQGLPPTVIQKIYAMIAGKFMPDLVIILDVPEKTGAERMKQRKLDRFELRNQKFHRKIRKSYLERAKRNPKTHVVLDASLSIDALHKVILQTLNNRFKING